VFLELKRQGKEIYFYTQPTYEVDFLIREGRKVGQLIQVCYSLAREETRKREMKALLKASKELKCKNLSVITWDEEGEERVGSKIIKIVPFWKWLLKAPR
jgi:predicted AAA+ superfamily ATPase